MTSTRPAEANDGECNRILDFWLQFIHPILAQSVKLAQTAGTGSRQCLWSEKQVDSPRRKKAVVIKECRMRQKSWREDEREGAGRPFSSHSLTRAAARSPPVLFLPHQHNVASSDIYCVLLSPRHHLVPSSELRPGRAQQSLLWRDETGPVAHSSLFCLSSLICKKNQLSDYGQ